MFNKTVSCAAALTLLSSALLATSAYAETLYYLGNPKGRNVTITLDPSMAGKTIGVYAPAQTPLHQIVDLSVTGSGGEVVTVDSYVAAGKETPAVAVTNGTVPSLMYQYGSSYRQIKILKPGESSSSSGNSSSSSSVGEFEPGDPSCGCLTPSQLDSYLAMYRQGFPTATKEQFCAMLPHPKSCENLGGGGSSSSSEGGSSSSLSGRSITAKSYLSYNKCLPAAKHGVLVKVDLTNVDPAALQGGQIVVATLLRDFDGDRRATIKPKSDGRYSPQPLLLAGPTGGYYFSKTVNTVTMVNWKGKRKIKSRQQKVVAFLYYGVGALLEVPLGNNLRGGKGTFEIVTAESGYSICARFERVRQYFNGYVKYG